MSRVSGYLDHFYDRSFLRSRLARRLIFTTIIFSSIITLLITAIQLYADYRHQVNGIHSHFKQIQGAHLDALAASVWTFDDQQVQNILHGIANGPDMERVEISIKGELKWWTGKLGASKTVVHVIPLTIDYRGQKRLIGELKIVAGLDQVIRNIWERAIFILLANGVKTFLVAGFMLMLVYYLITRHLSAIVSHVSSHDIESTSMSLELDRKRRRKPDELDDLVHAINEMNRKLGLSYGALRESEARMKNAQEIARLGNWSLDVITKETVLSDEVYRIYGISRGELESNQDADVIGFTEKLVHPDDKNRIKKQTQEAFADNKPTKSDYRIVLPSGELKYLHAEHEGVFDEKGNLVKRIGTVQDVTQLKQAHIALEKHRDHLEDIVQARTKELSKVHSELRRKERMATLGQLTATVSHELRNPLAAMRPSLYVLQNRLNSNDDKVISAIERIDRNIVRCDNIIDDLLDFTRIGAAADTPTNMDVWLSALIKEQEFPKGLQVQTNFQLEELIVNIAPDRLRRAVINILENAWQAMQDDENSREQKGSTLEISTRLNGDRVEIVIIDNGPGISDSVLARIYEPLFSTKSFGVGLGMATVQQIMQMHGGDIDIETETGKGTTIVLWIPCVTGDKD